MLQNRRLLYSSLALIGGVSGFVLGEFYLGRGKGVYVATFSMLLGLTLAWALWNTRSRAGDVPAVPPEPKAPVARQAVGRTAKVRVTKSQQGGKQR